MDKKNNKSQIKSFYIPLLLILVVLAGAVAVATTIGDVREATRSAANTEKSDIPVVADASDKGKAQDSETLPEEKDKGSHTVKPIETELPIETEPESEKTVETEPPAPAAPTFMSPVSGIIIKGYSDTVPVFSETMNDYRVHTGVDISGEEGEAVLAASDGTVGAIWNDPLMGTCMTVVHPGEFVTTYKGLNEILPEGIAQGVEVKAGQPIGAVGESALVEVAEEPHVHFEMTLGGNPVDPCDYIAVSGNVSYEG